MYKIYPRQRIDPLKHEGIHKRVQGFYSLSTPWNLKNGMQPRCLTKMNLSNKIFYIYKKQYHAATKKDVLYTNRLMGQK